MFKQISLLILLLAMVVIPGGCDNESGSDTSVDTTNDHSSDSDSGDTDADTDSDTDADTDSDTDADSDSNTDTESDTDTGEVTGDWNVDGELRMWHKLTITFDGPIADESDDPSPFMDYRLDVTFTGPSEQVYVVPGYFAADGNAANSSATAGNKWRVHFAPDEAGMWTYAVSFRSGSDVAVAADSMAGTSGGHMDGDEGSFPVLNTDKTGRDMRAKGMLRYVGGHYLQFAGNKEYFLKQGPDAPENLLAYDDFDGDFKNDNHDDDKVKSWAPHAGDWTNGDPSWQNDKGTELIGAINYLAEEGMNAFSFLTMNIQGDDKNVFPYVSYTDFYHLDVSRLDQWAIVLEHGTNKGFFLHFKTQETENELLLDDGDLGPERKLYYRELIARFAHNPALNWNLGEEVNDASTAQKKAWAEYFWNTDPYQHHIVIHNMGEPHYDLLGDADDGGSYLTGFSLQTSSESFSQVHNRVVDYLTRSADAGKPWAVACDEPGDAQHALRPAGDEGSSWEDGRKNALWGTFLAGGWGNEWYFGYAHAHSDMTCEDFRSRDGFWDYARYALAFFADNDIPVNEMHSNDSIGSNVDYGLVKEDSVYLLYLKDGGTTTVNLQNTSGKFTVKWFDPRNGGTLKDGSVTSVDGGGNPSVGTPPSDAGKDWLVVLRK